MARRADGGAEVTHFADAVRRRFESALFDLGELAPEDARAIRKALAAKLVELEQIDRVSLSERVTEG